MWLVNDLAWLNAVPLPSGSAVSMAVVSFLHKPSYSALDVSFPGPLDRCFESLREECRRKPSNTCRNVANWALIHSRCNLWEKGEPNLLKVLGVQTFSGASSMTLYSAACRTGFLRVLRKLRRVVAVTLHRD